MAVLGRARVHLASFDVDHDPAVLLYAALDLRLGIEARLHEYLNATLRQLGREAGDLGYRAGALLKRLREAAPETAQAVYLRWVNEQTGEAGRRLKYSPITEAHAQRWGKLGEVLRYDFFPDRPALVIPKRTHGGTVKHAGAIQTYLDLRDFLEETAEELAEACSGTLLTHRRFTAMVKAALIGPGGGEADVQ